jgi:hypothetical protein
LVQSINSGNLHWDLPLIFSSLGPALSSNNGPDLKIDGTAAQVSAHVTQESFDAASCEVVEACVRAPGIRTLLRFDGTIENVGNDDLILGNPDSEGFFNFSRCHQVNLLKEIMLYELIDPQTKTVVKVNNQEVIGRKQGFCIMDISQVNATSPRGPYDCSNQGLTRGWADVYDSFLECQFLDVTGVSPGNYLLRLSVNPDGLWSESNMTNNTVEVPVTIPISQG